MALSELLRAIKEDSMEVYLVVMQFVQDLEMWKLVAEIQAPSIGECLSAAYQLNMQSMLHAQETGVTDGVQLGSCYAVPGQDVGS